MLAVTMKDIMITETVDEDFTTALQALNNAGAQGKNFLVMDSSDGGHIMLNISNIMTLKELDE